MSDSDRNEQAGTRLTLGDDDERVLRSWFENLVLQDSRYQNKGLAALVRLAMADEEFRALLINDPDGVPQDLRERLQLPDGIRLQFFDNTADTLNVVLPPRAGDVRYRAAALREILRSRVTESIAFLYDDFDVYIEGTDVYTDPNYRD